MNRLTPDMQRIARALATGQILLCAPAMSGKTGGGVVHAGVDLKATLSGYTYEVTACSEYLLPPLASDKPKEPWRRGRPLR